MSVEFSEWITRKYIEYRGNAIGHERTVREFAEDYIGISQPLMSDWMKRGGKVPRAQMTINKLVNKYGMEVYRILKINPPDPLKLLQEEFDSLPPDDLKTRIKRVREVLDEYQPRPGDRE